jgi:hypothetical protein
LICLAALLGVVLAVPDGFVTPAQAATGEAQPVPKCTDPLQPTVVENPKVSAVLDPRTAWQPRGGTAGFTVSGNAVPLDGVNVIVCFGWPAVNWKDTKFPYEGRVSLSKFETNNATYSVVVPDLEAAPTSWSNQTALWTVPRAAMRIIAYGGPATPRVDVQPYIGITSPYLALPLAVLAVMLAFGIFYLFALNRGVPGSGLVLWMISTRKGVASLSQAQIVLWTFLIGASAVYVMALSGVLIDITDSTLVLLGIAGTATVGSKLQNSQQDTKAASHPDGKTTAPGPVLNLVAVRIADSEVRLAWARPTTGGPVTRYQVEYQVAPAANAAPNPVWFAVGETVLAPHHTVLGLTPGTNYNFQVRAVNAGGPGDPVGLAASVATPLAPDPPPGAPSVPSGLRIAEAPTLTRVQLAWSAATPTPAHYLVQYRRHDTTQAWTDVRQPPIQPEYAVDGLTSGVAYDFRVAAVNAVVNVQGGVQGGQGPWSAVVTAWTLRNPQWADLVLSGDGRGEIDVTRVQMLFFTLVAALFVGMKVLTSYVIPEIPQGIVLLMGISNGVYMTAKYIPD